MGRYRYPEDASRTLIGEVLARHIISETFHLPNEQIRFTEGRYGKPAAEGLNDFHFNISHSGKWIVCGAGAQPIGVDVEKIKPINFDIAKRFFHLPSTMISWKRTNQNACRISIICGR